MKQPPLKSAAFVLVLTGIALLNGCAIIALPGAAGAVGSTRSNSEWKGYPKYDVDPQVIYRIDDHRYVTMENYPDCEFKNHVSVDGIQVVRYHDDKMGINTELVASFAAYKGKLIIAAPGGRNLAFPSTPWGACTYGEKGCSVYIDYSTDGGITWGAIQYMQYATDIARTKEYSVVVTDDALYIQQGNATPRQYPMGSQLSSARGPGLGEEDFRARIDAALAAARPPDIPQEAIDDERSYSNKLQQQVSQEEYDKAKRRLWAFERQVVATVPAPRIPAEARTPSGMDHLVCDPTITPRGVTYSKSASPI
ncbi:T6SS immunity protein Tli3 family protein [Amantichitinum ursilacus]|uniref:Tli3-like domain-containing protein n=1 Tax=Amantichitinum ursilacus TaxID=857265 RepID=A0A0N0GLG5_9NEIS|nr:hypothetical protein [Amantichitinum ursilacus]KPC49885.1 hypothetical protein WG78_19105 [Amantichitinum ursilacus]